MAEAAAARREARRRRILENSHNRLQFISGKNSDESARAAPAKSSILDQAYVPVPEIAPDNRYSSESTINNGAIVSEPEPIGFLPINHNIDEAGDTEITNDLAALASSLTSQPVQETTLWEWLITYRYDIVLLSILMQVIYCLFSISVDDVYIFLPLVIHVFTKQMWSPSKPQSSIANVLLLLNGLAPARVQKVMFVAQMVAAFMQDVFVFIFTTICIQSLYLLLKAKFNT